MQHSQRGFSLVEQVAVLAITMILAASAIPSFSRQIARARVKSAATSLTDAIRQARQEAMMSGAPTIVCPGALRAICNGGRWQDGWFGAYAPGGPTKPLGDTFVVEQPHGITITSSQGRTHLRFHRDGTARETNQTMTVCLDGDTRAAQTVIVALNGRVRQTAATAENAARCARGIKFPASS